MNESEQDVWVVAMALGAVAFPHIATYGEVIGKSNGGTLNARGATSRCPRAHGPVRRQPGAKRKPLCRWQEMAAESGSFWLLLAALPALSTASTEPKEPLPSFFPHVKLCEGHSQRASSSCNGRCVRQLR